MIGKSFISVALNIEYYIYSAALSPEVPPHIIISKNHVNTHRSRPDIWHELPITHRWWSLE